MKCSEIYSPTNTKSCLIQIESDENTTLRLKCYIKKIEEKKWKHEIQYVVHICQHRIIWMLFTNWTLVSMPELFNNQIANIFFFRILLLYVGSIAVIELNTFECLGKNKKKIIQNQQTHPFTEHKRIHSQYVSNEIVTCVFGLNKPVVNIHQMYSHLNAFNNNMIILIFFFFIIFLEKKFLFFFHSLLFRTCIFIVFTIVYSAFFHCVRINIIKMNLMVLLRMWTQNQ